MTGDFDIQETTIDEAISSNLIQMCLFRTAVDCGDVHDDRLVHMMDWARLTLDTIEAEAESIGDDDVDRLTSDFVKLVWHRWELIEFRSQLRGWITRPTWD